jgi:hypothetical protein
MEYQPEEIRVSAVAIKFDPLNIEFARRQPQMPPLMSLISVSPLLSARPLRSLRLCGELDFSARLII